MIELLKCVEIFAGLNENELRQLQEYCGIASFENGDYVFRAGDESRRFYIVKTGSIAILRVQDDGSESEVARFIKGESFGEMDLIENSPRSVAAAAADGCELIVFPRNGLTFDLLLQEIPLISAKMLKQIISIIAGRIRSTNRLISEKTPWMLDLKRQLMTDKLTGLYNRAYLDEDYTARVNDYGISSAILMVKPDNFKYINDTFGHEAGDTVLIKMADTFKTLMKEGYEAIRYRGNELAAVITGADMAEAEQAALRLKSGMDAMDISEITGGKKTGLTFSLGVAVYPLDSSKADEVIALSYSRLYRAIEEGGDRIVRGEN